MIDLTYLRKPNISLTSTTEEEVRRGETRYRCPELWELSSRNEVWDSGRFKVYETRQMSLVV
jgi:hypothetical protein